MAKKNNLTLDYEYDWYDKIQSWEELEDGTLVQKIKTKRNS